MEGDILDLVAGKIKKSARTAQPESTPRMTSTREHLIYMAGQILRNFAAGGDDAAVAAAAEHLRLYWDPRMKAQAIAMLDEPDVELPGGVRSVFEALRR